MKTIKSGIVYQKTYEGMSKEDIRVTFVITYVTLEIKQGLFGIKRKFKINQRSEGLSNYSESLKLNKAYEYALAETWIEAHKNDNEYNFIEKI
jgi:hypothetical protein